MPAVFIHGVPDTYRVWELVIRHLDRVDNVTLALPGFDSPVPNGFQATKEEYVDWIIQQLQLLSGPVDLVGHDWGCIFVARIASLRSDLIRTWAAGDGPISKDYEWHSLAKIWQTPGAGEEFMVNLNSKEFSGQLEQLGVPPNLAAQATDRVDARMKDCILRLYRSAVTVGSEWQPALTKIKAPGLVLWALGMSHVRFASPTSWGRMLVFGACLSSTPVTGFPCRPRSKLPRRYRNIGSLSANSPSLTPLHNKFKPAQSTRGIQMNMTELNTQDIAQAATAVPENTPFVMLNLLRYKKQADYGKRTDLPPCSGKEAYYQRYVPAFAKIAGKTENTKNFKPAFVGSVLASLVGSEDEPWDDVVLVEYGNHAAFRDVAESADYEREAAPHRRAALENWRLIAMHQQPIV